MNTTPDKPKRTFHDIVTATLAKPRVRLMVDLTDYDTKNLVNLFNDQESMMQVLVRYARSFGSLVDVKQFLPTTSDSEKITKIAGRSFQAEVRDYIDNIRDTGIVILVGTNPYLHTEVAETLATRGNVVILLGKDERDDAVVAQHDLVFYMNLAKLSDKTDRHMLDTYNFDEFIKLLVSVEKRMPFVGAKHFVNKIMWRLGQPSPIVSQNIFQAAVEQGIVELFKKDNVDPTCPQVSACKVNRSNELVKKVLATMSDQEEPMQHSDEFANRMDLSNVSLDSVNENESEKKDPEL